MPVLRCLGCAVALLAGMAAPLAQELALATPEVTALVVPVVQTPPSRLRLEQSLWARRGQFSLGLQWRGQVLRSDLAAPAGLPVPRSLQLPPSALHMGLAMDLSQRTRLELTAPWADEEDGLAEPVLLSPGYVPQAQGMRLSLQLRSSSEQTLGLLRHGLRIELDSRSRFMLKPRGGGLTLHYQASF